MGKAYIPAFCSCNGFVVRPINATDVVKAARFANAKSGLEATEYALTEAWMTLNTIARALDADERKVIATIAAVDLDGGYIEGQEVTGFLVETNDLAGHFDCFDCVTVRTSTRRADNVAHFNVQDVGCLATWRKYVTPGHPFDKKVMAASFEGKRIGALEFTAFLPWPPVADEAFSKNSRLTTLVEEARWCSKYVLGRRVPKDLIGTAVACSIGASARSDYREDKQ